MSRSKVAQVEHNCYRSAAPGSAVLTGGPRAGSGGGLFQNLPEAPWAIWRLRRPTSLVMKTQLHRFDKQQQDSNHQVDPQRVHTDQTATRPFRTVKKAELGHTPVLAPRR
jgi:hypothetical protein